jgi:hypothetical protein
MDGYAGLSATDIKQLLQTQGMKDILAEKLGYYDQVTARARLKLSFDVDDAIDRHKARGKDQTQPQIAFAADKFTIETFLPRHERRVVDNYTHHSFDADVMIQVGEKLAMVTKILHTNPNRQPLSTYTLAGTEGIASSEPESLGGNGSDRSSEQQDPGEPATGFLGAPDPDDPPDPEPTE